MTVSELLPAKPLTVTKSPVEMNTTHKPWKIQGFADPVITGGVPEGVGIDYESRGCLAQNRGLCYDLCTYFDKII